MGKPCLWQMKQLSKTQQLIKWESQDWNPVMALSKGHRSLHGVILLLRCLGTTQAHLTPRLLTQKNTAFYPVTAHWSLPLFEGDRTLRIFTKWCPSPFIYVSEVILSSHTISDTSPLLSIFKNFLNILCVAYVHMDGRGACTGGR